MTEAQGVALTLWLAIGVMSCLPSTVARAQEEADAVAEEVVEAQPSKSLEDQVNTANNPLPIVETKGVSDATPTRHNI